jgi:glycosyltransferase involved in cell wall biosynthesis/ribosomal protein S18 acetylase RimI-like enzyme
MSLRFLLRAQLRRLRDEGYDVTGISAPGPWVAELEAEGIRHVALAHSVRAWSPARDLRAFVELWRLFRRERFDLVHTHFVKTGLMGRLAARLAGVRCVVNTIHGLYATPEDRALKRVPVHTLERLAARFSDLELYQSEEDLVFARRKGIVRPGRSEFLGSGIDLARFDPAAVSDRRASAVRAEFGFGPGDVVVGTIGRLIANKGLRELFEAAALIRAHEPNVRFLVVGDADPEKDHAIPPAELLAAHEHVVFAGWRDDVPDVLAAMDVFVLPSWREGMPRAAIEAAAMARPLVLTNIRGCREVARDGKEGLLVPARDPRPLAAAVSMLAADPALRRRLGEAARARALERFDENRVAGAVLEHTGAVLRARGVLPSDEIIFRRVRKGDAGAMAGLHRSALPHAFLPQLGIGFLRTLYVALAADETASTYVAEDGSRVVGFVAGVPSVRGFYRRFYRKHGARAATAAAPRLIRPAVLRRVIETARYGSADPTSIDSELLSIAVDPAYRGRGIARVLVDRMLDDLAAKGSSAVKVAVAESNVGGNAFYRRTGFRPVGRTVVHRGETSVLWAFDLHGSRDERCVG